MKEYIETIREIYTIETIKELFSSVWDIQKSFTTLGKLTLYPLLFPFVLFFAISIILFAPIILLMTMIGDKYNLDGKLDWIKSKFVKDN